MLRVWYKDDEGEEPDLGKGGKVRSVAEAYARSRFEYAIVVDT